MKTFKNYLKESQFLTDHNEIKAWLDSMEIVEYVIREDGIVDCFDSVILIGRDIDHFPIKFGKISRAFDCDSNGLTTLLGCPEEVGGYFSCQANKISSLEHCPRIVGNSFFAEANKIASLCGISEYIEKIGNEFTISVRDVKEGGLGLLLIPGLNVVDFVTYESPSSRSTAAFKIIDNFIGKPDDIYECQAQLIAADLEEFAQL